MTIGAMALVHHLTALHYFNAGGDRRGLRYFPVNLWRRRNFDCATQLVDQHPGYTGEVPVVGNGAALRGEPATDASGDGDILLSVQGIGNGRGTGNMQISGPQSFTGGRVIGVEHIVLA